MRHGNRGRKLGHSSAHKKAVGRNILRSLFQHGTIVTTVAKAKEFAPMANKLITMAKRADTKAKALAEKLKNPASGTPETQENIDKQCASLRVAYFRRALSVLQDRSLVQRLFYEISPAYATRNGGYTQVLHLNRRRVCDDAPRAILKLVGDVSSTAQAAPDVKADKERAKQEAAERKRKQKERKEKEKEKQKERKEKEKEKLRKEKELQKLEADKKKEKKEKDKKKKD